jgi:5-hydroxyisourate hydrolase
MPGISIHVVDVSRGAPARGMAVEVFRTGTDGTRRRVGGGRVGDGGLVQDLATGRGDGIDAATYEIELAAGPWFRAEGVDVGTPAFQERIVYRFELVDPAQHLHLPFKLTPWGVSVWRGI